MDTKRFYMPKPLPDDMLDHGDWGCILSTAASVLDFDELKYDNY